MTAAAIQYNLTDIQHRLAYGRARQLVQEFMDSDARNLKYNMQSLGVTNYISLYNSCFQTAKRNYPGCRVGREGKIYLVFEKVTCESREKGDMRLSEKRRKTPAFRHGDIRRVFNK